MFKLRSIIPEILAILFIPPLGALCDYVAFVWAELIVALSTIIVVWTWIIRTHAKEPG